VLHRQLGQSKKITQSALSEKWRGVCLNQIDLDHLLLDGGWKRGDLEWLKFVGLAASSISDGMTSTMKMVCEILAEAPEGVSASIQMESFREIYTYLSERNTDSVPEQKEAALSYMEKVAEKQGGLVNPANMRAPDCPPL